MRPRARRTIRRRLGSLCDLMQGVLVARPMAGTPTYTIRAGKELMTDNQNPQTDEQDLLHEQAHIEDLIMVGLRGHIQAYAGVIHPHIALSAAARVLGELQEMQCPCCNTPESIAVTVDAGVQRGRNDVKTYRAEIEGQPTADFLPAHTKH